MTKSMLVSLSFTDRLMRFSQKHKSWIMPKKSRNKNFDMREPKVPKFQYKGP